MQVPAGAPGVAPEYGGSSPQIKYISCLQEHTNLLMSLCNVLLGFAKRYGRVQSQEEG